MAFLSYTLHKLSIYPNRRELLQEYPELEEEDLRQALIYAASYLDDQIVPFVYEATT